MQSARLALQKQQQENSRLLRDGGDLRTAADKVQVSGPEYTYYTLKAIINRVV